MKRKNYNSALKLAIVEKFHTSQMFAEKMGIFPTIVSQVLNGRKELTDEQKAKWAKKLGKDVSDVFKD